MSYHGDIRLGDTIDIKFTTRRFSTGAPYTLAGSPVISAYVGNGTTEITAGITLTADFDSRTGLNNVRVVATSGNGFATATNVDLVITTGTVDSVSVVGEVIGSFSIENRSALMPTTATRTLDVSAGGEAGVDWANVGSPTTTLALTGTTIATTQKVDVETIKTNPVVNGGTITFPTTATLASTTNITAGTITTATNVTTVNGLAAGVITAASIAADAITDAKVASDVTIASVTGAVGSVTGNVGGNVTGSVGSVVGAVGSVTGAVGSVTAAITLPTIPTAWITADGIATDAIGSAELAASAITEIQAGLSTLDAAGIRTAVGLASANLDTQLSTIDTVVDAVLLDTAEIGAAGAGLTALATQASVNTIDDFLDTEIAALTTTIGVAGAGLTALATQASVNTIDDFLDTEIAAIKAKTDSLTFTTAGQVDANTLAIDSSTAAADRLQRSAETICTAVVGAASTTTSIVTSSISPSAAVTDQFKGRIVIFDRATTTANLRGQATDITASTAGGVLTVTALTTAPASGDVFVIV